MGEIVHHNHHRFKVRPRYDCQPNQEWDPSNLVLLHSFASKLPWHPPDSLHSGQVAEEYTCLRYISQWLVVHVGG